MFKNLEFDHYNSRKYAKEKSKKKERYWKGKLRMIGRPRSVQKTITQAGKEVQYTEERQLKKLSWFSKHIKSLGFRCDQTYQVSSQMWNIQYASVK